MSARLDTKVKAASAAWSQPAWGDEFVMQFDRQFVDINLGDCGILYAFADTAFWQCG